VAKSGCIELEQWRPVPGHAGQFVASTLGRIARVVGSANGNGYQEISFKRSMKPFRQHSTGKKWPEQTRGYAHHLVALAFLGNPPRGKLQVNHLDGDRSNNKPTNLEWSNQQDNIQHAWDTGLIHKRRMHRISSVHVALLLDRRKEGWSYPRIARELNIHQNSVGYYVRKAVLGGLL